MNYIFITETKPVFDDQYKFKVYNGELLIDGLNLKNWIYSGIDTLENIQKEYKYWLNK